ncbi:MAG: hypothetical protein JNM27_06885 [Leptospirales bacterium]|nr:hypothetical protein [Leptospirales bacterium]
MAAYSDEQLKEIDKVLKYIKQMEGIIRTSPSREQVERVRKELKKFRDRLKELMPHIDPLKANPDEIREQLGLGKVAEVAVTGPAVPTNRADPDSGDILDRFPLQKASAHCTDPDVNLMATMLLVMQKDYWPAVSEQHCKLDFSSGNERDAIRVLLENAVRSLKVLAETIEEYATADKQDFREQLLKMKNKQTRIFLFETNEVMKKVRDFLKKLVDDLDRGGGAVMNKEDIIKTNARFEESNYLEGRVIRDAIREVEYFAGKVIERLNLPQFKIKAP